MLNKKNKRRNMLIFSIPAMLIGYYISAGMEPGFLIYDWMDKMQTVILPDPFKNYWNQYSLLCIIAALIIYILIYLKESSKDKNYMHGREFGTARFAKAEELNKELADLSTDVSDEKNIVLSWKKSWLGVKEYKLERM